ncbi:uncharacterized protein LOC141914887 [Tubulanus polymorphus]|uniref:uncharacterized protein LOC141914887 n=1 Tax=Tubulanus polymorphus TaxID=672921 RepID=UPI003DA28D6B
MALHRSIKNIETHKTMLTDLVANISNTTQERMAELQSVEQDVKLSVDNMKIQLDVWYEEYMSKIGIRRQDLLEISKDALKKVTKCLNKLTMFESSLVNMEQSQIDIEDIEEFTNDHIQLAVGDVDALVEATQVENVNIRFEGALSPSKSVVLGELVGCEEVTPPGAVGGVRCETPAAIETPSEHKTFVISEYRHRDHDVDLDHQLIALPDGNILLNNTSVVNGQLDEVYTDTIFKNMPSLSVVRLDYETNCLYAFCKSFGKKNVRRYNLVTTATGQQVYKCTGFVPTLPGIGVIDACFITNNRLYIGSRKTVTYFRIEPVAAAADHNRRFIDKQSKMVITVDVTIRDVITTMNGEIILVAYCTSYKKGEAVLYHIAQDDTQLSVKHRISLNEICKPRIYRSIHLFCPTSSYIILFIRLTSDNTSVWQMRVNADGGLSDKSSLGEIDRRIIRDIRLKSEPLTICAANYSPDSCQYSLTTYLITEAD